MRLAIFFAIQIPLSLGWQMLWPESFDLFWKQYLIFLSLYAIVSTHWAGYSAEMPTTDE